MNCQKLDALGCVGDRVKKYKKLYECVPYLYREAKDRVRVRCDGNDEETPCGTPTGPQYW